MEVTHKLALMCADVLALYCEERFGKSMRECHDCVFQLQRDDKKYCYLMSYLGFAGGEFKEGIKTEIIKRYKALKEREEKPDA